MQALFSHTDIKDMCIRLCRSNSERHFYSAWLGKAAHFLFAHKTLHQGGKRNEKTEKGFVIFADCGNNADGGERTDGGGV